METQPMSPGKARGVARRDVLKAGLVAGAALSGWPLPARRALWARDTRQPKRGGILRVRGYDAPHFDLQLTQNFKTQCTVSFVYSKLVRHKVGAEVQPGTF